MKKIKKLLTIGLAVLLMLCMSSCTTNDFIHRKLKEFPIECDKYSLMFAECVEEQEILECVEFPNTSEENFNENEIYNQNGLRIIRQDKYDRYGNSSIEFVVYEQEKIWYLNQEFMELSETFISYSSIWEKWNNSGDKGFSNVIIDLRISFEQEIFIITASTEEAVSSYRKYPPTLWYLNREQGKLLYCDYLKDDNGHPCFNLSWNTVIIKNKRDKTN